MPRALIVTSMFLPYLAADMHRARLLAAELPAHGWEVELLVPGDNFQNPSHLDPNAALLAVDVRVHRAEPEWQWAFAALNSRSLGMRAYRPLRRIGDSLLSGGRFDLVYLSCAQHAFFHLGVGWKHRHGVPFVLDFHDPWHSERLPAARHISRIRRSVANRLSGVMEHATLKVASGIVSVSPGYLDALDTRYGDRNWPALSPERRAVIPFAASDDDYAAAAKPAYPGLDPESSARRTIVYTGAGGTIMEASFRHLCGLLAEVRRRAPSLLSGVRIVLLGTESVEVGRIPTLTRVAADAGLGELVLERPARVGYLEALRRVTEADGLLVLGIESAAYNPSKLFLYGASGNPLLACLREGSVVDEYFRQSPELGHLVHFPGRREDGIAAVTAFLREVVETGATDRSEVRERWLVAEMARRHAGLFFECLRDAPGNRAVAQA